MSRSHLDKVFNESWFERHRWFVVGTAIIGLVFLALTGPHLKKQYEAHRREQVRSQQARLKEWPDLPVPPLTVPTQQFTPPPWPKLASDFMKETEQRFAYIVDSYPDEKFVRRAHEAIDVGGLLVSYENFPDSLPMSFRVTKKGPVIAVNYRELLKPGDGRAVLGQMLIFRHESNTSCRPSRRRIPSR